MEELTAEKRYHEEKERNRLANKTNPLQHKLDEVNKEATLKQKNAERLRLILVEEICALKTKNAELERLNKRQQASLKLADERH